MHFRNANERQLLLITIDFDWVEILSTKSVLFIDTPRSFIDKSESYNSLSYMIAVQRNGSFDFYVHWKKHAKQDYSFVFISLFAI